MWHTQVGAIISKPFFFFSPHLDLFEAPTVLTEVVETDPIMQHEVFGPVLPIQTVNSLDEAISVIGQQERPLCIYVYSSNSKVKMGGGGAGMVMCRKVYVVTMVWLCLLPYLPCR